MMTKALKIALPVFILLLGIAVYISLANVIAQTNESSETPLPWLPFRGPLGRFQWGPVKVEANLSRAQAYRGCLKRGLGSIEISEEFKNNVVNIAKSDSDVQNLLSEGYNVTCIQPIIKTVVEADGSVVAKAKSAILTLRKDNSGMAFVWVDVENSKVTRIEIITRTVIEKP
ncbi:MAG: hypothetical protein ACPL4E_06140 [Thermoproteota archaeon]